MCIDYMICISNMMCIYIIHIQWYYSVYIIYNISILSMYVYIYTFIHTITVIYLYKYIIRCITVSMSSSEAIRVAIPSSLAGTGWPGTSPPPDVPSARRQSPRSPARLRWLQPHLHFGPRMKLIFVERGFLYISMVHLFWHFLTEVCWRFCWKLIFVSPLKRLWFHCGTKK